MDWLLLLSATVMADDIDTLTLRAREAGRHVVVIADMETHRPLQHATVRMKRKQEQVDVGWTGRFEVLKDSVDSVLVMCPNYLTRHVSGKQLVAVDTLFLIPTGHMLGEVYVYGKANKTHGFSLSAIRQIARENTPPGGVASFDFAKMLDRRYRRDQKHLARAKKILKEY